MGIAAHEAIEYWEKSARQATDQDVLNTYQIQYEKMRDEKLAQFPEEGQWMTGGFKKGFKDLEDRQAVGAWQVADYMRHARENDAVWRVLYSEVEFLIDFGGVVVKGFIDQVRQYVDGRIEAVDLKTGGTAPESPIQLATYSVAIEQTMGISRPTTGQIVHLGRPATARGKEKPTKDVEQDLTHWTKDRLDVLYRDMDYSESQGIYLPNPVDGCTKTCGVAQFCRVRGHHESQQQFATIGLRPSA